MRIEKLKTIKNKNITNKEEFNYNMLGRLESDCRYYLGSGNRDKRHLWAKDEKKQIAEMKKIYSSFSSDKKPEWLRWKQILEYEKQMVKKEYKYA